MTFYADSADWKSAGMEMMELMRRLFPICRSITGNGVRQTLDILSEKVDLQVFEVASGTQVLDWRVPREWNIADAWVKGPGGRKVIDFQDSNLHVVSYSIPVHAKMTLQELRPHLHSIPEQPKAIPYRTSYYNENWGFCLTHEKLEALPDGEYEVFIGSTLEDGALTYGEYLLEGESDEEILISTYTCHPSLCNDNLSGVVLAAQLADFLAKQERRHFSYRFLFVPETIGAITWLSRNEARLAKIRHGLVLLHVGDPGAPTYKRSRRGNAEIDRAVENVLKHDGTPFNIMDFVPIGSDERQYCSPGYNMPVGSLMKSYYAEDFPAYHTSDDNLDLVTDEGLGDSFRRYLQVFDVLENNVTYRSTNPKGEPQLGRRGLWSEVGGIPASARSELPILWALNMSDGSNSLLDVAERANLPFQEVAQSAMALARCGVLQELPR